MYANVCKIYSNLFESICYIAMSTSDSERFQLPFCLELPTLGSAAPLPPFWSPDGSNATLRGLDFLAHLSVKCETSTAMKTSTPSRQAANEAAHHLFVSLLLSSCGDSSAQT